MQREIVIYTTAWCGYCRRAKALLDARGYVYREIDVDVEDRRDEMRARSGRSTVPQIFIAGEPIGGCDELHALDAAGQLETVAGTPAGGGTSFQLDQLLDGLAQ